MSTTVRITGKRGKIVVKPKSGETYTSVIEEAAEILGFPSFDISAVKVVADGVEVDPTEVIPDDAETIDVLPHARLG